MFGLSELGLASFILIILFIILLPIIATIIVGVGFANMFGFTSITWWAFVILFYLIIGGLLGVITRGV